MEKPYAQGCLFVAEKCLLAIPMAWSGA